MNDNQNNIEQYYYNLQDESDISEYDEEELKDEYNSDFLIEKFGNLNSLNTINTKNIS